MFPYIESDDWSSLQISDTLYPRTILIAEEVTAREPSCFFTNHAQPEPKRVSAALVNSDLKLSKLPNDSFMAFASDPSG